jgi:hypothetical protein
VKLTLPSLGPEAEGEVKVYHAEVSRSERVHLGWSEPQDAEGGVGGEDGGEGGAGQEGAARAKAGRSERRVVLENIFNISPGW